MPTAMFFVPILRYLIRSTNLGTVHRCRNVARFARCNSSLSTRFANRNLALRVVTASSFCRATLLKNQTLLVVAVVVFINLFDIAQYCGSAVAVLMLLSVTAVTAHDFG